MGGKPVKTAEDFRRALTTLLRDLGQANNHYELCKKLYAAQESGFDKAMSLSRTFWTLTYEAHWETAVFRLCRVYDWNRDVLNLRTFLELIRDNPALPTCAAESGRTLRTKSAAPSVSGGAGAGRAPCSSLLPRVAQACPSRLPAALPVAARMQPREIAWLSSPFRRRVLPRRHLRPGRSGSSSRTARCGRHPRVCARRYRHRRSASLGWRRTRPNGIGHSSYRTGWKFQRGSAAGVRLCISSSIRLTTAGCAAARSVDSPTSCTRS